MRVLNTGKLCQLALLAGAVVAMIGSDAMAWSYGSWGSYGSYGSAGCYGSYGWYGPVGPLRRIGARIRARRAARAYYYGSYGSYGSYASYGSYGGGYVVSYACAGCCGSYGGPVYYDSTPVEENKTKGPETPTPAPAPAVAPEGDSVSMQLSVPASAKVYVNDSPTTSTGSARNFVSRGLRNGRTYSYQLRVEYERDGRTVVERKDVKLRAGDSVALSFAQADAQQLAAVNEAAKTELKLEVPENAKVFLAGASTHQTGTVRSYATTQLAPGEQWEGYTVRVELEQEGKHLVQERTLEITGGQAYELAFDFDAEAGPRLAQLTQ